MMDPVIRALAATAASIVTLAIVAVILSPKAQASQVIGAGGTAFATVLSAAEYPVTGGSSNG